MSNTLTTDLAGSAIEPSDSVKEPNQPRYRSRFGGFWPDLSNGMEIVKAKLDQGVISAVEAQQLHHWITKGYVIIENAVPHDVIDRLLSDTELAWKGHYPSIFVEHFVNGRIKFSPACPELRMALGKLLDIYAVSEAARETIFAQPIHRFLDLIFQEPSMAFQSLSFMAGSGQPIHQDTAYVVVSSPMQFAASWIALEDIQPNTGELEYYEGSHEFEEFLWEGKYKSMPPGSPDHERFLASLHEQAARMGLARKKFRPKKGDALIWSADLAHGGSKERDPETSRLSLVTHYCPARLEPGYFQSGRHSPKLAHDKDSFYTCAIHQ